VRIVAYKAKEGAFPAALAELKGDYLPDIPSDIFSGDPLVYRRTNKGYLLYSIGKNMKDEGGKDSKLADDITVRAE